MDVKKLKIFSDLNKFEKIALVIITITIAILTFFYSHWFSYRLALKHMDTEFFLPIDTFFFSTLFLVVVRIMEVEKKTKKIALLRDILIVILVASVFAFFFHGFCPACCEVHDPVYKYIFKMVYGHEYGYA